MNPTLPSTATSPTAGIPGVPPPGTHPAARRHLTRAHFDRLILILVATGSVFAIWSSVQRLRTARQKSAQLAQQIAKLDSDIEVMRKQWPKNRSKEVSRRFGDATALLFPGDTAVAEWMESLQRSAIPLALDCNIAVRNTRSVTNESGQVTVVQAVVNFPPATRVDSPRTPFARVLDFTQQFAGSQQRVDILEATFQASSNTLDSATAVIELWAKEVPKEAPKAKTASQQHAANP